MEANGTGVNKFTYYVSHYSFDEWKKLPDLQPKDIKASREIKVMFTGDLERTIFTNPFFFGKEKHYLRA
jgi:radial spoke head protein 4/6